MARTKALTNGQRKAMCIHALVYRLQTYDEQWVTVADIARFLGVEPSTKLRNMLSELAGEGFIDGATEHAANIAGFRILYSLPQHIIDNHNDNGRAREKQRKAIRLYRNGQEMEVLL